MFLGSLLFALAAAAAVPAASRERAPRIVVLGDSLTSGRGIGKDQAFPAILQQRLDVAGYEYQVINAGVSGDTSARALRRFEPVLEGDVRILIVALGANDGLRGVSVQQLKSNLSQIIDEAQRRAIGESLDARLEEWRRGDRYLVPAPVTIASGRKPD